MTKRALITGIRGQDGTYLAELLLERGFEVHGTVTRDTANLTGAHLHAARLEDPEGFAAVIEQVQPRRIYHLAAQSSPFLALSHETETLQANVQGTLQILQAARRVSGCRVVNAASAEVYGQPFETPQNEDTPLRPRSMYGISKAAGHQLTGYYREVHGIHASSAILYNHESPRRPAAFVTRKITTAVASIRAGKQQELRLGNLDARRDWGHARDYVEALYLMGESDTPADYVVASGRTRSVRDFCEAAFSTVGLDYRDYVVVDPQFFRPLDNFVLQGDATRIRERLGWQPRTSFEDLVREMVEVDCASFEG